jgi:prepilin-type N-terminal cleavage/methylation domain-containing protein
MIKKMGCLFYKGVTLVELLVGVAVMAVLLAISVPLMLDFIAKQRLEGVVRELLSDMAQIRLLGVGKADGSGLRANMYIVRQGASCYVMYYATPGQDPMCECDRPVGQACDWDVSANRNWSEIKTVQIPPAHGITFKTVIRRENIYFDPWFATYLPVGFSIMVESARIGKLKVYSQGGGTPLVCSPDGKVVGYPLC